MIESYVIDAEMQVLGALLLDPEAMIRVVGILKSEYFFVPKHQAIFKSMLAMHDRGENINIPALCQQLKREGKLESVGRTTLGELFSSTVTSANVDALAQVIVESYADRRIEGLQGILSGNERSSVQEKLAVFEQQIASIRSEAIVKEDKSVEPIGSILLDLYTQLENLSSGDEAIAPIPTGFYDLDAILNGGLHRQDLVIVAGRPSMGKSAFAHQIAYDIAKRASKPTLLFSLEMDRKQVVGRITSSETGISSSCFRSGRISQTQWELFVQKMTEMESIPFYISDIFTSSPLEMVATIKRVIAKSGQLSAVVVDYLQLMAEGDKRAQEIGDITRRFKILARECDIPVILLSQLNRDVEKANNKRPSLSDLRDSGRIEEDADIVIGMYRDEYYNHDTPDRGLAEVILLKHRNGALGTVKLLFDAEHTCFKNLRR
ncbi:hypothetical protein ACX27_27370 [Nostoc piscinale CENA21]|uniref:Replicative DNA helicase n=1 Tax=Nostoc piscinale CENA21 TaxID=224013 RepID=A0A0M4T866_9NOSO|nr:replicative DNA helicase [Nostoc piscinale]ALF55729.1 hypothetical protein ACX27_27370 [Nostoc piscinale CENA21]